MQEIDLELGGAKEFLEGFPRIMEDLEARRASEENKLTDERNQFEEMRKERKRKERELEDGEEHIKKSQGRLYAAKSNKEYEAMLVEIDTQKQKNSQLEEDILILYDRLEEYELKIKEMEKELKVFLKNQELEKKELEDRKGVEEARLEELEQERQRARNLIESRYLEAYDRIQGRLGDPALARTVDEVCMSCQYTIPPQMYNEVLQGQMHTCPNCQRILVYRETEFFAAREA